MALSAQKMRLPDVHTFASLRRGSRRLTEGSTLPGTSDRRSATEEAPPPPPRRAVGEPACPRSRPPSTTCAALWASRHRKTAHAGRRPGLPGATRRARGFPPPPAHSPRRTASRSGSPTDQGPPARARAAPRTARQHPVPRPRPGGSPPEAGLRAPGRPCGTPPLHFGASAGGSPDTTADRPEPPPRIPVAGAVRPASTSGFPRPC